MIQKELYKEKFYRTYSDEGYKIKQVETGYIYDLAIDLLTSTYTYEETTEKVESIELLTTTTQDKTSEYAQIIDILTGDET